MLSLDGGAKRGLVEPPEPDEIGALTWSPDDEQIVYVLRRARRDTPSPDEVWTVSSRGSGAPQQLTAAPLSRPLLADLAFHPNGRQLIATGRAEDPRKGIYEH